MWICKPWLILAAGNEKGSPVYSGAPNMKGIAMSKATLTQAGEVNKLVAQSGIERADLQALLESGRFTELLREFKGKPAPKIKPRVKPSPGQMIRQMIEAGKDKFTIKKPGGGEIELHVLCGREIEFRGLRAELDKRNLRMITRRDGIGLLRDFPMMFFDGRRGTGVLRCPIVEERTRQTFWLGPESGDPSGDRFLVVSK